MTLSASIDDRLHDMPLKDVGKDLYLAEFQKLDTGAKISANMPSKLHDGTPANETQIDWVTKNGWSVKTLFLSTFRNDRLIYTTVHSAADPGFLREYLYSLRFD